jgi:glycosyltransferase involved in cell wall biosynthesis
MLNIKFIFLGGVFVEKQLNFVTRNSIGVVQNAADVLQKNLISGLDKNTASGVTVINIPFVGSYPKRFRVPYFPAVTEATGERSIILGFGFVNIFFIKLFSRFIVAIRALFGVEVIEGAILFVYSAHLPFIFAALVFRFLRPAVKICLVVPDLPEYMGGGGFLHSFFKKIDSAVFYLLVKKIDFFVVLTEMMIVRLGVDAKRVVVVEGVAPDRPPDLAVVSKTIRSFLYTGTLARRYGITELVDAFEMLNEDDLELWICGEGDGKDYISLAVKRDKRIKYFGQMERSQVVLLQSRATILVNPRPPEGEFTKYSFPSKVIEYMISGRPVVMYRLDGIPEEYSPYYTSPADVGVNSFALCMRRMANMSSDQLNAMGERARNFILSEKNATTQTKKILDLIFQG